MRYTNGHGGDPAVANAITTNAFYDKHAADISISQLVKRPRAAALELLHDDEIVVDVSEELWMLLGSAVHAVIAADDKGASQLKEERLFMEVEGWKISGKPDVLSLDGVLTDYKVTSVWSFTFIDKPEWETQLNFYAELLRSTGYAVVDLRMLASLRAWQPSGR